MGVMKDFTADDIEVGKTYTLQNSKGVILTRKVLSVNSAKRQIQMELIQEGKLLDISTKLFVRIIRMYGINPVEDMEPEQITLF